MFNAEIEAYKIIHAVFDRKLHLLIDTSKQFEKRSEKDTEARLNNELQKKVINVLSFFTELELKYDVFSFFNTYNVNALAEELNSNEEAFKFVHSLTDSIMVDMAISGLELDHILKQIIKGVLIPRTYTQNKLVSEQMNMFMHVDSSYLTDICKQNVWLLILYLIKVRGFKVSDYSL